jgi:pyruvate,water dikinase
VSLDDIPETKTKVMLNVADPGSTTRWWRLPADGVGLARMEFLVSNVIRAHPLALLNYDSLPEDETKEAIAELTRGFENKADYFVDTLARGSGGSRRSGTPIRSSCGCRTSSRTNMPSFWAGMASSRRKRTR